MRTVARHVVLLTLVATVLCADRAVSVLPTMNQTVAQATGRAAAKLAGTFRRNTREFRSIQGKSEIASLDFRATPQIASINTRHFVFSPFQYRLPPPAL